MAAGVDTQIPGQTLELSIEYGPKADSNKSVKWKQEIKKNSMNAFYRKIWFELCYSPLNNADTVDSGTWLFTTLVARNIPNSNIDTFIPLINISNWYCFNKFRVKMYNFDWRRWERKKKNNFATQIARRCFDHNQKKVSIILILMISTSQKSTRFRWINSCFYLPLSRLID